MSGLPLQKDYPENPGIAAGLRSSETLVLLLGFATLILLMVAFTAVGMSRMIDVNQRQESIAFERAKKSELVHTLRFASRERTLDLHAMIDLEDFFQRDQHFLHFTHVGALFVQSRLALLGLNLSKRERDILEEQDRSTQTNVVYQDKVADLAMRGEDKKASALLLNYAIPGQNHVFDILNELNEVQKQSAEQAFQQTRADFAEARSIMFGLGTLALVLGISIAYFVVKKIAAHTQVRQRLLMSLDSIAGFPEHNPIAVVEISPQHGVTYANLSAKNQFTGVEAKGVSHPVFAGLEGVVEDMQLRGEHRAQREQVVGENIFAQWISSIDDGDIVRIYSLDITDRKRAEEELERTKAHLEELVGERTAALAASNRELESYSYSIAHDLRAPLRSIRGFGQILQEDAAHKLNEEEHEHLGRMVNAAGRMAELIDDILQQARLSKATLNRQSVDLSVIGKKIAERLSSAEPQRQVDWTLQEGVNVKGDPVLLEAVLENYFSNAWKYSSKKVRCAIKFGAYHDGNEQVVYVKDNGAGFSMKYVNKLFVLFQRLHDVAEFEGSGVGLASVSRIIQRHGGRVWAEGKEGEGACFFFSLPVAAS
jgi:signal transduction histidine kinase